MHTTLPLLAGMVSTTIFAGSVLPMLVKAVRSRDLSSYSLGNLAFGAPGRFAGYGKVGIGAVAHLRWDPSGLGTLRLDCVQTDNQLDGYVARACPAEPLAAARQVLGPGVSWQQDQASVTF